MSSNYLAKQLGLATTLHLLFYHTLNICQSFGLVIVIECVAKSADCENAPLRIWLLTCHRPEEWKAGSVNCGHGSMYLKMLFICRASFGTDSKDRPTLNLCKLHLHYLLVMEMKYCIDIRVLT
jgi:hypothetical protein